MYIILWNLCNASLMILFFFFAVADQRGGDERLARHPADVWAAELEGGSGCCHDIRSAWGVLFPLWSVEGYRRQPLLPLCFQINPHSWTCVAIVCFPDLLGGRLEAAENIQLRAQACLCYICAGNIEKLVSCWSRAQDGHCPLSLQVGLHTPSSYVS